MSPDPQHVAELGTTVDTEILAVSSSHLAAGVSRVNRSTRHHKEMGSPTALGTTLLGVVRNRSHSYVSGDSLSLHPAGDAQLGTAGCRQ